jgi:hypothetical protein
MNYHLLIPSLEMTNQTDLAAIAPALSRFKSLGEKHIRVWPGFERRLTEILGPNEAIPELPLAAICRIGMGLPVEGRWLCVSPVFLETGIEKIILHELDSRHLTREEANALIEAFNQHFLGEGFRLEAGRSDLWFLQLPDHLDIRTQPLSAVRGQSIYPFLPGGEQSGYWHVFMNEVQMLFHNHSVNADRERYGKEPVNGIWLWGEESSSGVGRMEWDFVISDEPISRGLARFEGIACNPLEQGLPDADPGINVLVVDDSLQRSAAYGDYEAWVTALGSLEVKLFEPLCRAWNERYLQALSIETDGYSIDVAGRPRWRFWGQC